MWAGMPPTDGKTSGLRAVSGAATARQRSKKSPGAGPGRPRPTGARTRPAAGLPFRRVADRGKDVRRLRQNRFFEIGTVRNWHVEGADALDRGVEVFEELVGDA